MALGWFRRWRIRAALRRYGKGIGATLLRDHGASEFYTPEQIDRTIQKLGFPHRYCPIIQAGFLPEQTFILLNPVCRLGGYAELRSLLLEQCSWTPASAAFEPLGVSAYVNAGDSIR